MIKLNFDRKPKCRMVGIRLTDEEYLKIESIALKQCEKMSEVCRVIIVSALKEIEEEK